MDIQIRDAQEWLNATYGARAGYNAVVADGQSGWQTMFALTRALQLELGITATSDAFGPTTMARLTAQYPSVGPSTSNTNILAIAQAGLWCKGYPGGYERGKFDARAAASVGDLTSDMGLTSVSTIAPKVFAALLTMDAYSLLSGGVAEKQSAQRWLNGRYLGRADFRVLPCDGLYSRNVQQGLMYAIQYEIGMADGTANGNYGPGTISGLKSKGSVASGVTSTFVKLFQAALILNGYSGSFTGTFDAATRSATLAFQSFSELPASGKGDYTTWASLLVSMGDVDRLGTASDALTTVTSARARTIYDAGYRSIGRYLTVEGKRLTPGELSTIFAAGLKLIPIMQESNSYASDFNLDKGRNHGIQAGRRARQLGLKTDTIIYFAVDYDATDDAISQLVLPYFRGVRETLEKSAVRYRVGVYGTRNVAGRVVAEGLAISSFVSGMSWGYSGNLGYRLPNGWAYDQIQTLTLGSGGGQIQIDKNIQSSRALPVSSSGVVATPLMPGPEFDNFYWWTVFLQHKVETTVPSNIYPARTAGNLALWYAQQMNPNYVEPQFIAYVPPPWAVGGGGTDPAQVAGREFVRQITVDDHNLLWATYYSVPGGSGGDTAHWAVTVRGYNSWGIPSTAETTVGDLGGWALDLASLWTSYAQANLNYGSLPAADYKAAAKGWFKARLGARNLANPADEGAFGFADLVADIDGYLVAKRLPTNDLFDEVIRNFRISVDADPAWRFRQFLTERFAGKASNARLAAVHLFQTTDWRIEAPKNFTFQGRAFFLGQRPNGTPTAIEIAAITEAFAELLSATSAGGPGATPVKR